MPRITGLNELPGKLSIHVYADHMPPHFHVRSPSTNAKIDIVSLQVLRAAIDPADYAAVVRWASQDDNRQALRDYSRRCNEPR